MTFAAPDDRGRVPLWEHYMVGQAAQASLGLIPEHALAVGIEVDGPLADWVAGRMSVSWWVRRVTK